MWTVDQQRLKLVRNAEFWALLQTYRNRVHILTNPWVIHLHVKVCNLLGSTTKLQGQKACYLVIILFIYLFIECLLCAVHETEPWRDGAE